VARYLIDANLPRWLSLWSSGDCEFVHDLGASWSDSQIWAYAAQHALTIVSKDADFSDRVLLSEHGPKAIHIRVGNLTINELRQHLLAVWPAICQASDDCRLVQVYKDRFESIS
jgi:predicted nuclease of predicted toxin-antitoxin system